VATPGEFASATFQYDDAALTAIISRPLKPWGGWYKIAKKTA